MTKDEAAEIYGMVCSVYGLHPDRVKQSATAWVTSMEELDVDATMRLVMGYMRGNGPAKVPTLVTFVNDVKAIEKRAREDAERAARRAEQGGGEDQPFWVTAWWICRQERNDRRAFPEQREAYIEMGLDWPPEEGEIDDHTYEIVLAEAKKRNVGMLPLFQPVEPRQKEVVDA